MTVTLYCRKCGEDIKPGPDGKLPAACLCGSRSFSTNKPHGLGAVEPELELTRDDRWFLWRQGIRAD